MKYLLLALVLVGCGSKRYEVYQWMNHNANAAVTIVIDTQANDSVVCGWKMWEATATEPRMKIAYQIAKTVADQLNINGELIAPPIDTAISTDPMQLIRVK